MLGLLLSLLLLQNLASASYSSSWKVEKLNEMSGYPLVYDSKSFDKFVEGPRNFSTIILFTAMKGSQNCEACRMIDPEYQAAALSWQALKIPSRLYFAVLDYSTSSDIFAKMKLNTAPLIFHFPPNEGDLSTPETRKNLMKHDKYDIQRSGDSAEDILKYVETIVHTSIPLLKPPEYTKFIFAIAFLLSAAAFMKLLASSLAPYLKNPLIWAFMALIFTLSMISGNMWNMIRGAPYTGREEIINSSFGSQYVLETRIVATIYGLGAILLLGLVVHVPKIQKAGTQRMAIYFYSISFAVVVSLLYFVFRIKNKSYPFRVLF